jgi:acyl carrier protein
MATTNVSTVLTQLAACLAVEPDRITADTTSRNVDFWDSMAVVEIVFWLQREHAITLPPEKYKGLQSVADVLGVLKAHGKLA